jgi:hypothetical protein
MSPPVVGRRAPKGMSTTAPRRPIDEPGVGDDPEGASEAVRRSRRGRKGHPGERVARSTGRGRARRVTWGTGEELRGGVVPPG